MKILILAILLVSSLQAFAGSENKAPGNDGGGGGVLKREGIYLTFGSAGLKVKVGAPQGLESIPNLNLLRDVLLATQRGIPDFYLGQLLDAILPSEKRRYFAINKNQLEDGTYKKLIEEYASLLKNQVDPNNLDLAAITIKEDTFLLPPFFQLKPAEQAAILFHESLWIVKPEIQYDELVYAEMVMQRHIEKNGTKSVYSEEFVDMISRLFDNRTIGFVAAIFEDIKAGLFKKQQMQLRVDPQTKKSYYILPEGLKIPLIQRAENTPIGYKAELSMLLYKATKNYPEFKYLKYLFKNRDYILGGLMGYVPVNPNDLGLGNWSLKPSANEYHATHGMDLK